MRFCKLGATFGVLNRRTLAFAPGLNLIEASNESGKSTLCAFLRVMLYGLSTRERGTLADKNRYLPWSGAPMQGTLELETEDYGNITLRRDTARANSPMGRFAATHTGSGDEVPGLTAADCGEALLGVPREVYERSAFIRQTGLAIDPDAELERRIAALISTGEEGASYSEASAALKKQLNIRRSNARNGQIPALEREIESTETALRELRGLLTERTDAESAVAALTAQEADLRSALAAHDLADRQAQYRLREDARRDADSAAREARIFRRMLEDSRVPPREVLEENRSRLRTVDDLDRQRQEAERKQADAERALQDFDAGGKPPALRPVAFLWLIFLIVCVAVLPAALLLSLDLSAGVLYGSVVGVVIFAALFALEWMRGREKARLHAGERARLDATDGSKVNATCEVTVKAILITDITLSQSSIKLKTGNTLTIEATINPEDATNKEVTWKSSDVKVATVADGVVTAVAPGTATITCAAMDGSNVKATCEVTVPVEYEYVDLGLRSGTLWATCNIGAEDPADVGDYFAWGEIEPKEKYTWGTYIHCNGASNKQIKYCINAGYWDGEGENPDGLIALKSEDDAATQLWGDEWCMPTSGDLAELNECPRKEYSTRQYNGQTVVGVEIYNRVIGFPSIFIPISGYINNGKITNPTFGYCWSNTNSEQNGMITASTFQIEIDQENSRAGTLDIVPKNRCYGMPIRPVRKK